jgi:hypothetical protein
MNAWQRAEQNPGTWIPITEDEHDELLGVLPPIYFPGGFAVSEAIRHNGQGQPVYLCVRKAGGCHFAQELTIREAIALARGTAEVTA